MTKTKLMISPRSDVSRVHDEGAWGARSWKGFDWDSLGRLHEKGFISDPVGKAKSVVLTQEGLDRSRQLFQDFFGV